VFGAAQRLHGATYVVDLELRRPTLDDDGVVIDIGEARRMLREVLDGLDLRNLDDDASFAGRNTTTEFLAHVVFERVAQRLRAGAAGAGLASMRVTLHESHVAWAAYEAPLG
jgi:6-pyruvoyl-tetrahydropterin synthase